MTRMLDAVEIEPDGPARAAVVWLHGLGADGHDFAPIASKLALPSELGVRFVLPHAPSMPVKLNHGMRMPAWYDIAEVDGRRYHDEHGVRRSAGWIAALIQREQQRGVPWHRIALAGFSQGGAVALFTALRFPQRLAGVVALSTYLVLEQTLDGEASAANRDVPILQAHGSTDEVVPIARGQAACRAMRRRGYDVEFHDYPIAHGISEGEVAAVSAFLELVVS